MLKMKNINENSQKRSLDPFTECTEWVFDRGNWEFTEIKVERRKKIHCTQSAQQFKILPVCQAKRILNCFCW